MLRLNIPLPRLLGPREVICAKGALGVLASLPASRVAVIATKRAAQHPTLDRLLSRERRVEFHLIQATWKGEPTLDSLSETIAALEEFRPDWIAAIGGGSVIDGAKLAWARYEYPHFPIDRLGLPFSLPPLRRRARFLAAPTTAGTGSEATSTAVMCEPNTGRKIPVVSHDFLPDVAVLDPDLTIDLPPEWTGITALDALSHAVEGYVSRHANPLADGLAFQAVRDILEALPRVAEEPGDLVARQRVQQGALFAGYVQNLRLVGLAHALAHNLDDVGIPHGLATGLLLPVVMEHNASRPEIRLAYDRLAQGAGLADGDALRQRVADIPALFRMPQRLGDWPGATLAQDAFEKIGKHALADRLSRVFPVPVDEGEAAELLRKVW